MTRREMMDKYIEIITIMSDANGKDMDVCLDKLIYTAKNLEDPNREVYSEIPEMPKEFWEGFLEDYAKLP